MEKLFSLMFYTQPNGTYREGFHIGFFPTYDEAKKAELFYRKEVPGFKDYPCDAEITEVPVIGANGDTVNCVYRYVGWNENADFDEVDIIESDCYVDYATAETAFREAKKMLQRKEWAINRYIVGHCDWQAGFIRVRD